MPILLPALLNFQGSAHLFGVGSFSMLYKAFSLICRYIVCKDGIVFQRIEFEMQCLFWSRIFVDDEDCMDEHGVK